MKKLCIIAIQTYSDETAFKFIYYKSRQINRKIATACKYK